MKSATSSGPSGSEEMNKENTYGNLLNELAIGKTSILTGNNGTGKSRFFEMVSLDTVENLKEGRSKFSQLACFSGTHNDKYPRSVWWQAKGRIDVCYLGYRVGNNMISDLAPFRTITRSMLTPNDVRDSQESLFFINALEYCLDKIGIDRTIKLRFRYGKNKKSELSEYISSELTLDLFDILKTKNREQIFEYLDNGSLLLQTLVVERAGSSFLISDLSSGERAYMIALLGALFCVKPRALVLFDEPENSLHPAWQKSILRDFQEIFAKRGVSITTVIATHSPLVAASSDNRYTYTCNFPNEQKWRESRLNGKTSDAALKDQFDLYSSRSPEVIRLVQRALKFISKGDLKSVDLMLSIDKITSLDLQPEAGDPLRNIIKTLKHVRQHNELP